MALNTDENFTSMEVATATHQFRLNYSNTKGFPIGKTVSTIIVAGLNFQILYYPKGWMKEPNFIGLSFVLSCQSEVIVSLGVILLDNEGKPALKACQRLMCTFSPMIQKHGFDLIRRSDLEANFLKDDCFVVVCSVTILNDSQKEIPKNFVNGIIPYSANDHFAELLESKEMVDVTFEVDGESFTAHRLILSARSPVFKAELFSVIAESKMKTIKIEGIKPAVFKAMLHFIYTDTLLYMCDEEDIPCDTLVRHLLEAGERYALDGLKMICEERLIRVISMDTIVSSLAVAEEHNCVLLKVACLEFAAEPEILVQLALNPEYIQLMQRFPSLLDDVGSFAKKKDTFKKLVSKKHRNS